MARKKPTTPETEAPSTDTDAERRAEALEVADQHPGEALEPASKPLERAGEPLEPASKPLERAGEPLEPAAASSAPRARKPSSYTAPFRRRYS